MSYVIALALGLVIVLLLQAGAKPRERQYIWAGLGSHFLGTVALLWLHETRGGDMDGYAWGGVAIADLVRQDPFRWLPELLKGIARADTQLDLRADATGAMLGLAASVFLLVGNSLYAACFVTGCFALAGQVLLYRVISDRLTSDAEREIAAVGCLLVPSVSFWTSGLVKEAFSVAGLGLLVYGIHAVLAKRRFSGLVLGALGAFLVAAVKPYILFPVVLSTGGWIFASRGGKLRAGHAVLAIGVAVGGIVALGTLFPQFGVEKLGESISAQRFYSHGSGGGSNISDLADEAASLETRDTSLTGQIRFLPLALVNAVLRPFLFEARSAPQLGAAVETAILGAVMISLLWRIKLRKLFNEVTESPVLLACAVFVMTFGAAVGLASQNLGTLSRYRVPMMPAFVTVMLLMRHRFRAAAVPVSARPTKGSMGRAVRVAARAPRRRMTAAAAARLLRNRS